jgi:hypothetical protein
MFNLKKKETKKQINKDITKTDSELSYATKHLTKNNITIPMNQELQ